MSCVPPTSHTNVPVAPKTPCLSQPSQGSSEGPSQRNPHSRGNKKATSKTVTLAYAVQKTVVLSHKVMWVDISREHGQIPKVNATRTEAEDGGFCKGTSRGDHHGITGLA